MQGFVAGALESWASVFANSAALRTAIDFAHVGGLVLAGGCAIAADRQALIVAHREPLKQEAFLETVGSTHRVVVYGLIAVILSGLLLLAADWETYWHSVFFWIKMGLFGLLLLNGIFLQRVEAAAAKGVAGAWRRLTTVSIVSMTLWFLTTLVGAALPNTG